MGRATAEFFARDGARVAVFARSSDGLAETEKALRRLGSPDAVGIQVDVTNPALVREGFSTISERWGSLNAFVNTIGPGVTGSIDALT